LRGVKTVVHLAATIRDQPGGSIEELNGIATWRLVQAAELAGVERFVFFSALGATSHDRTRFLRAKALAEEAVAGAALRTTTLRCSLIYSPGDRQLALIDLLSLLPVVPVTATMARARAQPIAADDVAACIAALATAPPGPERHAVLELAGPQELTHREAVEEALRIKGHRRRVVPIPSQLLRRALGAYSALVGPVAFTSPDEADLLAATLVSERGTRDAEALGVRPRRLAEALG
jgi:NADH dehydrogenase